MVFRFSILIWLIVCNYSIAAIECVKRDKPEKGSIFELGDSIKEYDPKDIQDRKYLESLDLDFDLSKQNKVTFTIPPLINKVLVTIDSLEEKVKVIPPGESNDTGFRRLTKGCEIYQNKAIAGTWIVESKSGLLNVKGQGLLTSFDIEARVLNPGRHTFTTRVSKIGSEFHIIGVKFDTYEAMSFHYKKISLLELKNGQTTTLETIEDIPKCNINKLEHLFVYIQAPKESSRIIACQDKQEDYRKEYIARVNLSKKYKYNNNFYVEIDFTLNKNQFAHRFRLKK
ncbi:hypothetical protein [Spartinivicinus poritis]|uniref:Uncharacterized protein n=1 Tax=Spartinivicinus poritis TaxID=2994640 RepID=A0ABT5UEH4_9GAMM|nr:hypothetical protein [Spartinivicinus sp. A2-2]MDE1464779.1 hypothetical protein [Spartinivicinus sp. A2-2]